MKVPNPLPILRTPRLSLRAPQPADVEARLEMGRDPEIYRLLGADISRLAPFGRDAAESWVARIAAHPAAWVIARDDRAIGEVALDNAVDSDMRASIAVAILDKTALGHGYGTEAVRAVCGFAFERLNLHRISVRVLAFNTRAIRAYEKVGFKQEGRERESAHVGDAWHDDVLMGLLAREFALA
ncbi:MAG: GNAT family N-acetyltransferase [Beijerinckiaceae bacterium]